MGPRSRKLTLAKPVEVADMAAALTVICTPSESGELMLALAARAAPDAALSKFSSRQLVVLISAFVQLDLTAMLPSTLLNLWLDAVRTAHQATPLLAYDARSLEASLDKLGLDASWIKRTEMLNTWSDLAGGRGRRAQARSFTDDELRATFESIDTDSSGDIDMQELKIAIKVINPTADDAAVAKMLSFADNDGDLQVSFEEFKRILRGGS